MSRSDSPVPEVSPTSPEEPPALVILNPAAGNGKAGRGFATVERALRTWPTPPLLVRTSGTGDATRFAADAPAGTGLVIAAGGDGTANEVANGLLQRPGGQGESTLGYVPLGTGCDLARALGLPRDPSAAVAALASGSDVEVDVGRIEMATESGAAVRYFLNAANVGAAPAVTRRLSEGRWLARLGPAAYIASAAREALSVRPVEVRLETESRAHVTTRALNVSVCNGPSFGGGMRPCPQAGLDTGSLDVVVVGELGLAAILALLPHLRRDGVIGRRGVSHFSCRTVRIESPDPLGIGTGSIPLEVDGEVPGRLPATFSVVAEGLRIRVPAAATLPLGRRHDGWYRRADPNVSAACEA